jgi:aspartate aminotransferase
LGKNEVRLAYVLNLSSINAAMDCLEKALEEYHQVMGLRIADYGLRIAE